MKRFIFVLMVQALVNLVSSDAELPEVFRQSTWLDNTMGEITFTTWSMNGWDFTVGNQTIDNWHIVDKTRFDPEGYLPLRSLDTFDITDTTYYSFVCLKFTKLSDGLYKYHILHDPQPISGDPRVKLYRSDDLTSFSDVCDTRYINDATDYSVMIRRGTTPEVTCPNPILGAFDYGLEYPSGNVTCSGSLDTCLDSKMIEFHNSSCSAKAGFSDHGKLSCIDSIEYNTNQDVQILAYNLDEVVNNNNTFRISCIRITKDGNQMSIAPDYCRQRQTPQDFPQVNGVDIGQKLTTVALSYCRIDPPSQTDENDLSGTAIAGIFFIGIAVFAILLLGSVNAVISISKRCKK